MPIRIRSAIPPLLACGLCFSSALAAETRTWTSADGTKSFEARLEAYDKAANEVTVTLSGGKRSTFSVAKLSAADRAWLEKQQQEPGKAAEAPSDGLEYLLKEDFNNSSKRGLAAHLLSNKFIHLAEKAGPDGSDAIRVDYVGYARGSERVTATLALSASTSAAKLAFDVRFDDDFQWVLGGKLHGLAPANSVTGGNARRPDGWSARLMFGNRGGCLTYLYDQSDNKWGIEKASGSGAFKAGQWHHVEYEIVLNEPGKSNGSAKVTIDGKTAVTERGVEFRGKGGPETEIRNMLFSTFHGGHDASWAPKDRKGAFTTVHAYFDNFTVTKL